ncbi:MAG: hypothetical protein LBM19_04100 [Holosporales bacterium]|nr:hypothetical protein [Holosporales bacterium]
MNFHETLAVQAAGEKQTFSQDALRPIGTNEAKIFAAWCLGISPKKVSITEATDWERFLNKGMPGSQMFLAKFEGQEYVVKSSRRLKGEFDASVKMNEILRKTVDLGNLEIVIPYLFGVFRKDTRQFVAFIDLNDPSADVEQFERELEKENVLLFQFTPKIEGIMLGDLFRRFDEMTVEQLRYMGFVLGGGLARLHKIGYEKDGISQVVHRDMHPGQVFIDWENKKCIIIDFDKTDRQNIICDFNKIIGRIMDNCWEESHGYREIAYIYGFLEGYGAVLPEAVDFDRNDFALEFFDSTSFIPISIATALAFQFFEPVESSSIDRRTLSRNGRDMRRVIFSNLPYEEKQKLLSIKASDRKYEYGLFMAELIDGYLGDEPSLERIEALIGTLNKATEEYNDLLRAALQALPPGKWISREKQNEIMNVVADSFQRLLGQVSDF